VYQKTSFFDYSPKLEVFLDFSGQIIILMF